MPLICFWSPKGGVGKTTLAANVANGIAATGAVVNVLDLDPQNALRLHFGVALSDGQGFTRHLMQPRGDWRSQLRRTGSGPGLLAYGSSNMGESLSLFAAVGQTPGLLANPVREILTDPDLYLVVDTPPGPSPLLAAILPLIDLLVIVLLVDATSVSLIPTMESGAAYAAAGGNPPPPPSTGFVLNQFDPRTRLGNTIATAATRRLGDKLLGTVYRDEHVSEAVAAQKPLATYAPSAKATRDIAGITDAILTRLGGGPAAPPRRRFGWFGGLRR